MRGAPRALLAAGWALASHVVSTGCSDSPIVRPRGDSGIAITDGGTGGPLALRPGMAFNYRGILVYRDAALGNDQHSLYTMKLTIERIDDQGAEGDSTLQFTASDAMTDASGWTGPADNDSWVARLGPSQREDAIMTTPITATLGDAPKIPARARPPAPKMVPPGGTFFLDMRKLETIRARFSDTYVGLSPGVVDPALNQGKWRMSFSGPDTTIFYNSPRTRSIMLEYDPRGFLVRLDEALGDGSMRPSSNNRLELISGP